MGRATTRMGCLPGLLPVLGMMGDAWRHVPRVGLGCAPGLVPWLAQGRRAPGEPPQAASRLCTEAI